MFMYACWLWNIPRLDQSDADMQWVFIKGWVLQIFINNQQSITDNIFGNYVLISQEQFLTQTKSCCPVLANVCYRYMFIECISFSCKCCNQQFPWIWKSKVWNTRSQVHVIKSTRTFSILIWKWEAQVQWIYLLNITDFSKYYSQEMIAFQTKT